MVKRAVRGSLRPIGRSIGQLEGLGDIPEHLGASLRVWEASEGVWRDKLAWGCGTIGHRPLWGSCPKRRNLSSEISC